MTSRHQRFNDLTGYTPLEHDQARGVPCRTCGDSATVGTDGNGVATETCLRGHVVPVPIARTAPPPERERAVHFTPPRRVHGQITTRPTSGAACGCGCGRVIVRPPGKAGPLPRYFEPACVKRASDARKRLGKKRLVGAKRYERNSAAHLDAIAREKRAAEREREARERRVS